MVPERAVGAVLDGGVLMRGANISDAFRRVWARPWLLAALALTNVGLAMVLSAPLSAMLAVLLDQRPAAERMAAGDDGLLVAFFTQHLDVAVVASVAAGAGVVLYGLFSWIMDGGVLAALAVDGDRRARGAAEVLHEAARRAGRMVKLGLLGIVLRVVPVGFGAVAYGVAHAVVKGRTFQPNMMVSMLSLAAAALAWTAMSVAVDYARGMSLAEAAEGTRSWVLVVRGVKMLWTRRGATLQLVAFGVAGWLAVGVVYWVVAGKVTGLVLLTVLRLGAVVARAAITMTTLTAAARVAR
jgi:hypothetical protein